MKTIYKSLVSLAAALLLSPAAFAQVQYDHEKYELSADGKVGYNKYLVSTKPDANSEYTLRLETFLAGGVKATAIPTDFVLVLDNSGSMYYDYRPGNATLPATIEFNDTQFLPFFVNDYGTHDPAINTAANGEFRGAAYNYVYANSTIGASATTGQRYHYASFAAESSLNSAAQSSRYYKYDDPNDEANHAYYKIFYKQIDGCYNLMIKLKDKTYRYLYGGGIQTSPNTEITGTTQIIYNGPMWRIKARKDALMDGVDSFVDLIAAENAKDQWHKNATTGQVDVTKHQVSIVAFGSGYAGGSASITPVPTGSLTASKVVKGFTEVQSKDDFISAINNGMSFRGSTYIDCGVTLARMLLESLEGYTTPQGENMSSLTSGGGPNRKKVVVVFTDGEPNHNGQNFVQTTFNCIDDGYEIKKVGIGNLNGRIYSIDLCMKPASVGFLEHLSSDYPYGYSNNTGTDYSATLFTGKKVPLTEADVEDGDWPYLKDEQPVYYKDSSHGDMASVFANIAGSNVGGMTGEQLVVLDVMSDSFELPREISGKVKFYTAQCIGTKMIDGKEYLAFAKEIPADSRPALDYLWVEREVDGNKMWVNICEDEHGYDDIDQSITYTVPTSKKTITVKGFEFADLWCGLDQSTDHMNNTRLLGDDDPNKEFAKPGYRGFKLIIEFQIKVSEGAVGGTGVPTNKELESGLYHAGNDGSASGTPIINYQKPVLTIPVQLAIRKEGLQVNESASFTVQRRTMVEGSEWEDYTTFVVTCTATDNKPMVKLLNLNPDYYYRVKENGWSWAYSNRAQIEATFPSTEDPNLSNPIVIVNTPIDDTPKHAEAVKRNELKSY
jgi:hypothetical protein